MVLDQSVNDKYDDFDLMLYESYSNLRGNDIISEHQIYFKNLESFGDSKGIKHRLRNALQFWKNINASDFIISIISTGYVIPFIMPPKEIISLLCSMLNLFLTLFQICCFQVVLHKYLSNLL